MMAFGLTPAGFVKIWGAVATLVGWWGWSRVAFEYMSSGQRQGRFWRFASFWIAVVSPLLFTSRWGGTDIALWAAVPWVLILATRASVQGAQPGIERDALVGLIIGVCVVVRYASLFLVPYAILIIVGQSRLRRAFAAKRLAALGAGLLPGLAIQVYTIVSVFDGSPPGGVSSDLERLAVPAVGSVVVGVRAPAVIRAWESVSTLAGANAGVFFWLPGTLRFWTASGYELAALALAGVILIGLPCLLMVKLRQPVSSLVCDLRVVAAGLLIVLPLFLWTCGLFVDYAYVGNRRYYEPLRPLAACIAYSLATMDLTIVRRRLTGIAWSSGAYVIAFVVMTAVEIGAAFVPTPQGDVWRRVVLGAEPRPWPSFRLTYEFSQARRFVLELMKDDPSAILITTEDSWFYAEPKADRSRIMRSELCAATLYASHISGPVRFLILEPDPGTDPLRVKWPDAPFTGRDCWPQLPGVQLLRQFPEERLRVLQADIPAETRLQIRRP